VLITLISGLTDVTPSGIVGATWHGSPLAWFYVIVYPGSPWSIDWANFGGDLIVWCIVPLAGIYSLLALRHEKKKVKV
jgi:hypothetical protein